MVNKRAKNAGIIFNAGKSNKMMYGSKQIDYAFTLDNKPIPREHSIKDLGIHLYDSLSLTNNVIHIERKSNAVRSMILNNFIIRTPKMMKCLYDTIFSATSIAGRTLSPTFVVFFLAKRS